MLIAHADVNHARPLAEADELDELARYLNGFIDATAAGGAEMAAIVAITPHICGRATSAAAAHSADRHGRDRCRRNPRTAG
jgi:aspartate/glutamate racemase